MSCVPLRLRKANHQPSEHGQKSILVARLQAHSRQKIRTDHLQAIAPRFVAPQHQRRCLERLLDYRQLALVRLEIENLPRFRFFPGQVLSDLPFEFFFGQFPGFVHPGCTIELLTVPPRYLRQFRRLGPPNLMQIGLVNPWQMFVNGHQVVGLAPGFRELPLQKLIERTHVVEPPVLSGPNLTQIAAQIHKPRISFLSVALSHAKISSIFESTNTARRRLSLGAIRGLPLVVKHVKPIKVAGSWSTNEFGVDKLLIAQAQSQLCAADAAVLREADAAVRQELAGFDLADRGADQLAEFPPLFVTDRRSSDTGSPGLRFRTNATMATSEIPLIQE